MTGEMAIMLCIILMLAVSARSALAYMLVPHPKLAKALKRLTGYVIAVVLVIILASILGLFSST